MTWFKCVCGKSFEDRDDELCPSGINIRLSALANFERDIAIKLDEYFCLDEEQQYEWAKEQLGFGYTPERKRELIKDIISKEISDSKFSPTHECPNCGKIGIKKAGKDEWEFYEMV